MQFVPLGRVDVIDLTCLTEELIRQVELRTDDADDPISGLYSRCINGRRARERRDPNFRNKTA
jgi:hypothetical protein